MMGKMSLSVVAWAWVVGLLLAAGACQSPEPSSESDASYVPSATVKDLMLGLIDTSADVVWDAVLTVVGPEGVVDKAPQTEEEWGEVRYAALRLAEAANLLMIPGRRVARPGEKSEFPGIELEPEEMDALLAKDRETWVAGAQMLRTASLEAVKAAEAKDAQMLFEVGDRIEATCENCHTKYWYPNQVLPPGYENYQRK
jgi:hypothetical protein